MVNSMCKTPIFSGDITGGNVYTGMILSCPGMTISGTGMIMPVTGMII